MKLDPPEEIDGAVARRVVFEGPYEPVPGRLTVPAGNGHPGTLLLLGHGGGGSKDDRRFPAMAARFASVLDATVVVLDGPNHGERAIKHQDRVEQFRLSRRALVDPEMPRRFGEEYRVAVDACRAAGIGNGPLLYIGFSMGTVLGVPAVAHLGDVAGAVFAIGGTPAVGGVGNLVRPLLGEAAASVVDEEDDAPLRGRIVLEAAARIVDTQVLMVNTTRDVVFPIPNAFELFDAFTCPKRIAFWDGEHTTLGPEAISFALDFLDRVQKGVSVDDADAFNPW